MSTSAPETVLVTGGAGYIGSHTAIALINAGHNVVVIDNYVNSKPDALDVVQELTGTSITVIEGDVRDRTLVAAGSSCSLRRPPCTETRSPTRSRSRHRSVPRTRTA